MRFIFFYILLLTIVFVAGLGYFLQKRHLRAADPARSLTIACAMSMRYPVAQLAKQYQAQHQLELVVEYASEGELTKQIRRGEGSDLLVSADLAFVQDLRALKPPQVESVWPIGIVRPVIVVQQGNPRNIRGLQSLLQPGIKLSLPDPNTSAVGRVLRDALDRETWETLWDLRLSGRETSSEVANDVKLGVADVGIVWETTLNEFSGLDAIATAELNRLHGRIVVGLIASSPRPVRASRFAEFLASPGASLAFKRFGFESVAEKLGQNERPADALLEQRPATTDNPP